MRARRWSRTMTTKYFRIGEDLRVPATRPLRAADPRRRARPRPMCNCRAASSSCPAAAGITTKRSKARAIASRGARTSSPRYSGSLEIPGSNLRCSRSASVRMSTTAVTASAILCGRLSGGALGGCPGRLCRRHGFFLGLPDDGLFGDKLFGRDGLAAFFCRHGFLCDFLLAGFLPRRAFFFP